MTGQPWGARLAVVMVVVVVGIGAFAGVLGRRGVVVIAGVLASGAFLRLFLGGEVVGPPGPFTRLLDASPQAPPVAGDVQALERRVELSTATAGDAYRLLRPAMSDVAEEWLRATHGVGLTDPSSERLLPADVWALVRPDGPRPDDPHAPGPSAADVDQLISQLEGLP